MGDKNYTGSVPPHQDGKEITAEHSVECENEIGARNKYEEAKRRLLSVNSWQAITGKLSAAFHLTDKRGKEVDRDAEIGDYLKIDIKGPGSSAGRGYEWARVEEIREINEAAIESIAMTVRPAPNPQTPDQDIAHFYSPESTSTFVVTREHTKVSAGVYDKNIKPNSDNGELLDALRNAAVGLAAKEAFSKLQWQALAEALLENS